MEIKFVNLVPLNGTNYITWKIQCKMALIRDGLLDIEIMIESVPDPRTETVLHVKYLAWRDRVLATIVLLVEPSLLHLIGDPVDPAVLWKKLVKQFQKKTWTNRLEEESCTSLN